MAKTETIINVALIAGLGLLGYKAYTVLFPKSDNSSSGAGGGGGAQNLPLTYDQLSLIPNPTLSQINNSDATGYQKFATLKTPAGTNISPLGPLGDILGTGGIDTSFKGIGDFFSNLFGGGVSNQSVATSNRSSLVYRPDVNPNVLFNPATGQAVASTTPELAARQQASPNAPAQPAISASITGGATMIDTSLKGSSSSAASSSGGGYFTPAYTNGVPNYTVSTSLKQPISTPANQYYTPAYSNGRRLF